MYASKYFVHGTILTSLMVRVGSKVAAVALASIACLGGVETLWLIDTHREMAAATELRALGGTILWAWRLDDIMQQKQTASSQSPRWLMPGDSIVTSVYLTNCGQPQLDEKLACLESLRNLRYLALTGTNATDAALIHVAKLSSLEWLDLGNTLITDAGLRNLATLKNLRFLNLAGTRVTPDGIVTLRTQLPFATIKTDYDPANAAT